MLTLLFAYGAYRNAKSARRILAELQPAPNPEMNILLVAYGAILFFLWPLLIPAAVIRYAPKHNPLPALVIPAVPLLSLIFLGVEFYFVYSFIFLIIGFNFTINTFMNIEMQEKQESSPNS
jgi:hypothetical protein